MKNLLALFWVWAAGGPAWGAAQIPSYGQQLEAVHSARSAANFMDRLNRDFGHVDFELDSLFQNMRANCATCQIHAEGIQEQEYNPCARYHIALPPVWAKADFDQDGRPDLLANDGYGSNWCVLNRGAQPPLILPLALRRRSTQSCVSLQVLNRNGIPVIAHLEIAAARRRQPGREAQVWQDTLAYHLGDFVEYNARPRPLALRKVGFWYRVGGPPREGYRAYNLDVNLKSGRLKSTVLFTGYDKFRGRVAPGLLDTLRQQMAYFEPKQLREEYGFIGTSDAGKGLLFFRYPHRPAVRTEDYGMFGTYGLRRLYDTLEKVQVLAEQKRQLQKNGKQQPAEIRTR